MIERLAAALGEADKWSMTENSPDWKSDLPAWKEYEHMATAAIEHLRTAEMLDALKGLVALYVTRAVENDEPLAPEYQDEELAAAMRVIAAVEKLTSPPLPARSGARP